MSSVKTKQNKGFTLVEMLVYIAILLLMSTAAVTTLLSLSDMYNQYRLNQALRQTGHTVFEHMIADIRRADGVDQFASSLNNNAGRLSLEVAGIANPVYELVDDQVFYTDEDGFSSPLSGSNVTVDSLQFNYINSNGETGMVRVSLGLTAAFGQASSSVTFFTSAVMRGTYD